MMGGERVAVRGATSIDDNCQLTGVEFLETPKPNSFKMHQLETSEVTFWGYSEPLDSFLLDAWCCFMAELSLKTDLRNGKTDTKDVLFRIQQCLSSLPLF